MSKNVSQSAKKSQSDKFIEAAREAGCSDDEEAFNVALKRVAKSKVVEAKTKRKDD